MSILSELTPPLDLAPPLRNDILNNRLEGERRVEEKDKLQQAGDCIKCHVKQDEYVTAKKVSSAPRRSPR